jgi:transposase
LPPAVTAARWNTHLKAFYQRLVEQGKDKKLALIACARKLIIRLNTIATKALTQRTAANTMGA